ncbi:MFS general substrate transporter [Athelia psychrophila]|uniref:MFS general substrate transporter n=1 Tax=Athelia psychrophila TaxID=1759441 RepID=A0A165X3X5_9AGAM|nr:MFS general substrate transporter [Fibularhizoctonia sp. CBS 109695]
MGSNLNPEGRFKNIRVYWLAVIAYWGIILFGYDTGVAGGVVSQAYFQSHFGLIGANGKANAKLVADVSSNVVSVLQAGAFFGALGRPISARIGRRWSLMGFAVIFAVGAVLTTVAGGNRGICYIYAGRVISGVGIGGISAVATAYVLNARRRTFIMFATGTMLSYFINYGCGIHYPASPKVWRIPFSFQLVPIVMMMLGLFSVKESPRWLASRGRIDEALVNLAYLRRDSPGSVAVKVEFAEIEAQINEEREARQGLGVREAFLGKGNWPRFVIAFFIFLWQHWSGQSSVAYYAPQIFTSIGYTGHTNSLLASGVYGVVKVASTALFVFSLADTLGRKKALFISAMGMGTLFFIVGAILKIHPVSTTAPVGGHGCVCDGVHGDGGGVVFGMPNRVY